MTLNEELILVEEAKTNIQAFEKIYSAYVNQIYIFIFHKVGVKEACEDITSEVFLAAVDGIKKFNTNKGVRFRSWLYKTAHNKIVDYYRKNKKNSNSDIDSLKLKSERLTPEESVNLSQRKLETITVIKLLNPRYQNIIILKFFSELEIPEIAEVLEIENKRVSVVLHRALESFRKKFKENFPESEIFN